MPAEKQFYRADYVRQHFIHYSTITETTMLDMDEYKEQFGNRLAFPDPKSRFGDEINEGLMLHRFVLCHSRNFRTGHCVMLTVFVVF